MKNKAILLFIPLFFYCSLSAQMIVTEEPVEQQTSVGKIYGSLKVPASKSKIPVALIVAGSGPTDRNGNQPNMQNNSLKMLSDGLYYNGIATLCFDKRKIGESKDIKQDETDVRIEDFAKDVEGWVNILSLDKRFSEIIIIGHSEGSLIGMLAINNNKKVNKFVSLAGSGKPMNEILKDQLSERLKGQPQAVTDMIFSYIEKLEKGETISDVPPSLSALFRPSVQPYLISCFKYNPQTEIAKLNIPVLIVQGTTDIQVPIEHAELLSKANPKAKKEIIENMNHVLKKCENTDLKSQLVTYSNPNLPLETSIVKTISDFIKEK